MRAFTTSSIARFLSDALEQPGNAWSIGNFGAVGEFARDPEEPVETDADAMQYVTARGGIRVTPCSGLRVLAYETLAGDGETWNQAVAFCLPRVGVRETKCPTTPAHRRRLLARSSAIDPKGLPRYRRERAPFHGVASAHWGNLEVRQHRRLQATHQEMNAIAITEIGRIVMGPKGYGQISKATLRERDTQFAQLFRNPFQGLRIKGQFGPGGRVSDEPRLKSRGHESLINDLYAEISCGSTGHRQRECTPQRHTDTSFGIDRDLYR